ncbi:MAG TPA: sigma factor, partial [Solirubrobacteraceae bacterium]|nr:sigma factor [Solirubrobacteraceae bacterium]
MEEQTAPLTKRLRRMLGDPHAAEDVRQEAFARAWTSAPRDATPDHQRAWLHRTATNLALDEL